MFCKKCGAEIGDDARFCPKCGYDTQGENEPQQPRNEEIKPKKFFNILDGINDEKEPEEQKNEENKSNQPTFSFDKMFINPNIESSTGKINPILDEINEIENSINNSNTLPPIFNEQEEQPKKDEEKTPQEEQIEKYDDFDDDMEFIEEAPEEPTQNKFINYRQEETRITNFKDVLEEIRKCSEKIEKSGFEIETEEIDLNGTYQVIFKIKNEE